MNSADCKFNLVRRERRADVFDERFKRLNRWTTVDQDEFITTDSVAMICQAADAESCLFKQGITDRMTEPVVELF